MKGDGLKIHVLHLIGSTGLYGAERWILAQMRALDTSRFRSTLVNLVDDCGPPSAVVQAAKKRGLDALDFDTGGKFNPVATLRLAQWASQHGVDIIHGHGFKSDVVGLVTAKLLGCRVMTTPHGWSLEKDKKLALYEKIDRFFFRFMDLVCPLSPGLYGDLAEVIDKSKLRFILNGVDVDEIRDVEPAPVKDRESYQIGYVGQLIERKDVSTLIAAFGSVCQGRKDVRLTILGDGPKLRELQLECELLGLSEKVEFPGFRDDAASLMKSFDLFVLTSLLEGIPRCVMEAFAASIPVVASDIPGNRDLVSHGKTGLLFAPGDRDGLAECIRFMMDHADKAVEMAGRGNAKVIEEYSNRKMAREYGALYADLVIR